MAILTDRFPAELVYKIIDETASIGRQKTSSSKEGLPSNTLVSLSLVSRIFRQCAQERLFRDVILDSPWKAYLFISVLTSSRAECQAQEVYGEIDSPCLNKLAQHVRSLQFRWPGHPICTMGRGGGSAICEIIRACPLLESISIEATFFRRCKQPIIEALASRKFIKEFALLQNPTDGVNIVFQWTLDDVVAQLFSKWDMLEALELEELSSQPVDMIESIPKPIPVFNCALRKLKLRKPNLDESELYLLLKSSRETIRKLWIDNPSSKIQRPGLFRILKECIGPDLESLSIFVTPDWHHLYLQRNADLEDPAQNPSMLDILFKSSFRKIKFLRIRGPLASSKLLELLPETIVDLRWGQCDYGAACFAAKLFTWRNNKDNLSPPPGPPPGFEDRGPWLPNLEKFHISDAMFMYKVSNI
ncbi:uncharacterized protein PGTG_17944 [Puccinia graminis f. sp. tritici CRL 75-36-700-3]|uniref:F-box domain-containing protein n=1 Tax=Puccinia graminis f. sp. tritici (strain CRL 75-36-700-3 / race SCCL) TaxID=418459 RepID=E3L5U2_PUCGT|nr:uncharacterized protein PGTG_17944 [Puccinia graminis f. sp. tritici CRL 75-36-700-3]EFP91917.2 hypothetical protein PGTG_17944 [Puccinia graminis f. sp. tritici CRL 75-36-700-3]